MDSYRNGSDPPQVLSSSEFRWNSEFFLPWVRVFFHGVRSVWTPHKNCTQPELNQVFNGGTNSNCEWRALPLCHCGLLYLANLCYICNLWLNWETYLLLFNMTYDICPGPVFQCEFNGGVHFVIRLTIFGNFFVLYVCICVIHHFSMWIQWWCLFCDQTNHIW